MLTITPKGRETAIQCREGMIKFDETMFSCLSEEEAGQMLTIVDKLLRHLSDGQSVDMDYVVMMEMDERIQQRMEHPGEEEEETEPED
jgi:hypothetical protein